ncbi:DNA translocase FtsK [bacterium]|nr:DNA translocase FtsK [bacterium]
MSRNLKLKIVGLLMIVLAIILVIAMTSYNSLTGINTLGAFGHWISRFLINWTLGYAALVFPFLMFLWGAWIVFNRNKFALLRFTYFALLLAFEYSILLGFKAHSAERLVFDNSGVFGGIIANFLYHSFDVTFTKFLLIFIILVTLFIFLRINALIVFERIIHGFGTIRENWDNKPGFLESVFGVFKKSKDSSTFIEQISIFKSGSKVEEIEEEQQTEIVSKNYSESEQAEKFDDEEEAEEISPVNPDDYDLPTIDLLNLPEDSDSKVDDIELHEMAQLLTSALENFGVRGKVVNIMVGPVIIRFEIEPDIGIRISKFTSLSDDIARILSSKSVRIIAPIPGKNLVGVEVPNPNHEIIYLRDILDSDEYKKPDSPLMLAFGKTSDGEIFTYDLRKTPHLLIAGATGSGKSVCLNSIIMSILFRAKPHEVKLAIIDPKKVELAPYRKLKNYHLVTTEDLGEHVVTTPENAIILLKSVEAEMENRYNKLASAAVRNIDEFNEKVNQQEDSDLDPMPYIVLLIDEFADLMLVAKGEVEEPIARLAQMARAVGIHLVLATQRPSVDVITGVIKANFPARIAFNVASKTDSRTILDMNGAEKLLGRGDMLFLSGRSPQPIRIHNCFVSLDEVENVLKHISLQPKFVSDNLPSVRTNKTSTDLDSTIDYENDPLFDEARSLVILHQQGSISLLQRRLRIGYSRAARIVDQLEEAGVVGPYDGSKAREVLIASDVEDEYSVLDDE